ncbi:MAG: flavodoxin-dependent (E)-4-hydroxy-3-methylbut-2-enyl-diphosphate synthase [Candidatus Eiseniibacteriota bacterium]|nr:MAG: flavodoxin-dependent (E)-4-hydroxy-3-methylbut-2-enyl-diphosphate synthase [Candidatus Eisenbacteria bacterium]
MKLRGNTGKVQELPWRRRKTVPVMVGPLRVGGGAPVVVESMTKTDTRDAAATLKQVRALERAGCELVRIAVPDMAAARALGHVVQRSRIPVVADVHFDHRLALAALEEGVAGIRLNPGNIADRRKVEAVVRSAQEKRASIRVGVNAGSLSKTAAARFADNAVHEAMVESALEHVSILEKLDFRDVLISVKSSDVATTVRAYRTLSSAVRYPLHVGITEAGTLLRGSVVSAVGVAVLLSEGIGDAVRVSLAASPVKEVEVGFLILGALGLRETGPVVICCPTCGRCEIDVQRIAREVERRTRSLRTPLAIAVMGCGVNGPGEARQADVGIAGGKGEGLLFSRGRIVGKVREADMVETLLERVRLMAEEEAP